QRQGWEDYAQQVTLTNPLGDQRNVSGLNQYIRSNLSRRQPSLPFVDDAPVIFDLGTFVAIQVAPSAGGGNFLVTYDDTEGWVSTDDSALLLYTSAPFNPTINYFSGPYRFAGAIEGDSVTPPTSPATISSPFSLSQGNKLGFYARLTQADGRMSSKQSGIVTIGA
ncbi:MAG TPA: hypothetical protein VLV83_27280, partial [Acidobacteriota bacterium]|nr:hypothetical protein [Acidobacteriota bacterium]